MRVQLVGVIAAALIVLVWGFFLATGRVRGDFGHATLVLDRGHGIDAGTSVTYLGVEFGTVERVTLHHGRVIAELRFRREGAEIRKGDSIRVSYFGLFGDKVLDLIPGPRTAPLIGPGDTLFAVQPPEVPSGPLIEGLLQGREKAKAPSDSSPP